MSLFTDAMITYMEYKEILITKKTATSKQV
jgi:hypothetical protein